VFPTSLISLILKPWESNHMDKFRVTERKGWGDRIGGALAGVVIGLLMFVVAFPLLWWNEGRALDRAETLAEGLEIVIPVDAGQLDAANEGRLVHLSGVARPDAPIGDEMFGVSADALKLSRIIEMYQWVEVSEEKTVQELGGGERTETTYTYSKAWSSTAQNSSTFQVPEGHENPGGMPFDGRQVAADEISVGAYLLGRDFVDQIEVYEELPVTEATRARAASDIQARYEVLGGRFHKGDPAAPMIGDVRIRFESVRPQEVSAVGSQKGARLEAHFLKSGDIALLEIGRTSANAMFKAAEEDNLLLTWALRLIGFILMWAGLSSILWPAKIIADFVPFLGSIVGGGVSMITGLIAFGFSALTISLAWIAVRPLIGGALLVVALAASAGVGYLIRRRRAAGPKIAVEG
jgi:hypothetical protein